MRQRLFLVPVYIGSLKYFERLFPYLEKKFDVLFLLVRGDDERRRQMVQYCTERGYPYCILNVGLDKEKIRIPLLTPLIKRFRHMHACRKLLKELKPEKIVLTRSVPPHDVLLNEGNRLGIETIELQWSFHTHDSAFLNKLIVKRSFILKVYYRIVDFLYDLLDVVSGGFIHIVSRAKPKKVGVFDRAAVESYARSWGYDPQTISVVGTADFQIVHDLKSRIETDQVFEKKLFAKYNIDPHKKNIVIIAQSHHLKKATGVTPEAQVTHYGAIIRIIRDVFPAEEADILFKLHPSDTKTIYDSYQKQGVKIYADEAATEELICLSDLCISDPWTSADYLVIASDIDAVFVNFSRFQERNSAIVHYNIVQAVTNKDQFVSMLKQYKTGTLEKQYDNSGIDLRTIDKIVALIEQ